MPLITELIKGNISFYALSDLFTMDISWFILRQQGGSTLHRSKPGLCQTKTYQRYRSFAGSLPFDSYGHGKYTVNCHPCRQTVPRGRFRQVRLPYAKAGFYCFLPRAKRRIRRGIADCIILAPEIVGRIEQIIQAVPFQNGRTFGHLTKHHFPGLDRFDALCQRLLLDFLQIIFRSAHQITLPFVKRTK